MNKRDVIKYCLTLPNTFEDYPFPDDKELIEQSYQLTQSNIHKRKINKNQ